MRREGWMWRFWFIFLAMASWAGASELRFQDGDRVVLLGNTFMERAQKYGQVETAMTLAAGEARVTFRNLAWSGDTVYGDARSYFGPPQEGFDRLRADLARIKPTVVVVCYGAVAAFEGEEGVGRFVEGYGRLLGMIKEAAGPREVVLVSPPPAETLGAPMPEMGTHNKRLEIYRDGIRGLAEKEGVRFADLYGVMGGSSVGLTDNGLHFTEQGYAVVAPKLAEAMGLEVPEVDGRKREKLREKIVVKNEKFFHQWRPSNETYLRLFRKHEQGQNAKELDQFDAIIASREAEIGELKREALEVSK
ncbi:MAG: SGNH/GDSL hydrolase family protein [Verrucomicrobiaceae bacterium]